MADPVALKTQAPLTAEERLAILEAQLSHVVNELRLVTSACARLITSVQPMVDQAKTLAPVLKKYIKPDGSLQLPGLFS